MDSIKGTVRLRLVAEETGGHDALTVSVIATVNNCISKLGFPRHILASDESSATSMRKD
jgi:hypothetical protein